MFQSRRGVGYEVAVLKKHVTAILGLDRIRGVRLHAPPDVRLKNVDLTINLETLSFYIPRE
jgi:NADH/NAD ratio-sensing transcriptional regulator Rex